MITFRAALDVDPDVVSAIENRIATRRSEIGTPWRALTSFDQAVLYLVWIRHDFTFAELGAHFGVSTDCAWVYATETADVLARHAPDLAQGLRDAEPERHMVLDGTLIATASTSEPSSVWTANCSTSAKHDAARPTTPRRPAPTRSSRPPRRRTSS